MLLPRLLVILPEPNYRAKDFCFGRSSLDRRPVLDWPFVQRTHFERNRKGGTIVKRQGGQDIVEFALMIPLFFLCIIAIVAFGLYFSDWVTYNNMARSLAREAVVAEFTTIHDDSAGENRNKRDPTFPTLQKKYVSYIDSVTSHMYVVPDSDHIGIWVLDSDRHIVDSDGNYTTKNPPYSVNVEIKAVKNPNNPGFLTGVANVGIFLPDTITVNYFMYDENNPGNKAASNSN